jgi:hypothetical protein
MSWPRLDQIFNEIISGVQTKNDRLFVDFDRDALAERMKQHLAQRGEVFDAGYLRPYVVGPFDYRWIYYDPRLLGRARWQVMRHMVQAQPNIALVFMRQSTASKTYDHALVVDALASDRVFYSRRGAPFVAPLWQTASPSDGCTANLNPKWIDEMAGRSGSPSSPRSLLAYIYAVLHSPEYRSTHLSHLRRDFPRIPLPESPATFAALAEIGERLIAKHLGTDRHRSASVEFCGGPTPTVLRGYPRLRKDVLQLNARCGLRLSDPAAASFELGGHSVLLRWLKVRRGRMLSAADMQHIGWLHDLAISTHGWAQDVDKILTPTFSAGL